MKHARQQGPVTIRLSAVQMTAIYILGGALWVLVTNWLLSIWFPEIAMSVLFQAIKDGCFMLATAVLLYFLIQRGWLALSGSEQRLREQHALLEAIIEGTTDAVFIKDGQGRYRLINTAGARFLGKPTAAIIGQDDTALFSPGTARRLQERDCQVVTTKEAMTFEDVTTTLAGVTHIYSTTKVPYRDAEGRINGVIGIARDITVEKRNEEARARLAAIVESTSDAIIGKTLDGVITSWNAAAQQMYGYCAEEVLGHSIDLLVPPDRAEELPAIFDKLKRGEQIKDFDTVRVRKDGREIPVSLTISPVYAAQGQIIAASVIARDISERKQMEMALRDSEERFRVMAETVPEILFTSRSDGSCEYVSPQFYHYTGLPAGAALDEGWMAALHPEDRKSTHRRWRRAERAGELYKNEYRLRGANGTYRWFMAHTRPIRNAQGRVLKWFGSCADIDELKRTEEALQLSEERFRTALKTMSIIVFHQDRELRYTWIYNPQGSPFEEVLGKHDAEVLEQPEEAERLEKIKRRVLTSGAGERQTMSLHFGGIDYHYELTVEPLRNAVGQVVGITCAAIDITAYKQLEAKLRQQAKQLTEMDHRKDEFLAMLAHELRNPLAPIQAAVDVLKLQSSSEDTVQWARDVIGRQIGHLTHLVNDLLDVARITQGRIVLYKQPVDLTEVITRAVEATRPLIDTHQHRLTLDLPASPLRLEGDPNRLVQVIANLLSNAAKYTNPGGQIWLSARQEANNILVQVRDTGIGIASDMLPLIFDLFTQTKRSLDRSQGGLGLGLTLVRRLVEMHGGRVQAFSAGSDQGSEFVVRLPALAEASLSTDQAQNAPTPEGQWPVHRILVVEDNPDIAQSLVKLLSALGHKVSAVSDGAAALEAVRTFQPEVVFLDIGLPGMDGYTVARRLRKEHHQTLRLVALTGYGQKADRQRAREAGFDHHLLKPVTVDTLQTVLMAVTRS